MATIKFNSIHTYISPQTSFKRLQTDYLTINEKNIIKIFGLQDCVITDLIIYCMKQSMSPGQRLHFLEGIFESNCPWLLEFMELFWDYCKFHKYIFDENNKCWNIFDYYKYEYYYPYEKKKCVECEKETIMSEIKVSKERYYSLNNIF